VTARRVAFGGWLFASAVLLAVLVVRSRNHDEQLTEHERVLSNLERDVYAIGEVAMRVIP
jgi:hypothetical protein